MRLSPVLLSSLALLGFAAPAIAAPQTTDDGDDAVATETGKAVDARRVVIDQAGETTSFSVSFEAFTRDSAPADTLILFLDVNEDSKSDHFVRFQFAPDPAKYYVAAASTPDSVVGCQKTTNHGTAFSEENKDLAAADAAGWQTVTANVPTAHLGGATSFRWALYVATDSLTRSTYDYVPDSANPRGGGSGTATQNFDGCDTNGDGTWGGDGDQTTADGAYPVALTDGVKFPPPAPQQPQQPQQPVDNNPLLPDPVLAAIPAPLTLKTIRMPDVRPGSTKCHPKLCTIESVELRLQKMGLRNYDPLIRDADFDDIPKKYRKYAEHGHVVNQSPSPGEEISEPNLADYPDLKRPPVRLYVWHEPQLRFGCNDSGIKGVLRNEPWPGTTSGTGKHRVYGAEDILKKKGCTYSFTWRRGDVTEPRIDRISLIDGKGIVLGIVHPKKPDLEISVIEGDKEFPAVAKLGLVGPARDKQGKTYMPATGASQGMVVARVQQLTAPTFPAPPGTEVTVTDAVTGGTKGEVVASGRVSIGGLVFLAGKYGETGEYRITAHYERGNAHPLDGETTLDVRSAKSPLTTISGRRFRMRNNRWKEMAPATYDTVARASEIRCPFGPPPPPDLKMQWYLEYLSEARNPDDIEGYTSLFINTYLHAVRDGTIAVKEVQDVLTHWRVSVANLGDVGVQPVGESCSALEFKDVRHLSRGIDLKGALPVISTTAGLLLTNGSFVNLNEMSAGLRNAPVLAVPRRTGFGLIRDDAADVVRAVISTGGGNATAVLDDAARGVISTGGGNVISTGGGNMTVTTLLNEREVRAMMAVVATGGARVISTGGGNITDAERAAGQKVIQTGHGNLIGQAGGNLTVEQYRGMLASLAVASRLISDKGLGLTAAENEALQAAVISTGGGNLIGQAGGNLTDEGLRQSLYGVISTGGGNLAARIPMAAAPASQTSVPDVIQAAVISTGGGNVIASDGASLAARDVLSRFVSAVISTGGGNLARLQQVISTGGGNVADAIIGQDSGSLIGDNGGG